MILACSVSRGLGGLRGSCHPITFLPSPHLLRPPLLTSSSSPLFLPTWAIHSYLNPPPAPLALSKVSKSQWFQAQKENIAEATLNYRNVLHPHLAPCACGVEGGWAAWGLLRVLPPRGATSSGHTAGGLGVLGALEGEEVNLYSPDESAWINQAASKSRAVKSWDHFRKLLSFF